MATTSTQPRSPSPLPHRYFLTGVSGAEPGEGGAVVSQRRSGGRPSYSVVLDASSFPGGTAAVTASPLIRVTELPVAPAPLRDFLADLEAVVSSPAARSGKLLEEVEVASASPPSKSATPSTSSAPAPAVKASSSSKRQRSAPASPRAAGATRAAARAAARSSPELGSPSAAAAAAAEAQEEADAVADTPLRPWRHVLPPQLSSSAAGGGGGTAALSRLTAATSGGRVGASGPQQDGTSLPLSPLDETVHRVRASLSPTKGRSVPVLMPREKARPGLDGATGPESPSTTPGSPVVGAASSATLFAGRTPAPRRHMPPHQRPMPHAPVQFSSPSLLSPVSQLLLQKGQRHVSRALTEGRGAPPAPSVTAAQPAALGEDADEQSVIESLTAAALSLSGGHPSPGAVVFSRAAARGPRATPPVAASFPSLASRAASPAPAHRAPRRTAGSAASARKDANTATVAAGEQPVPPSASPPSGSNGMGDQQPSRQRPRGRSAAASATGSARKVRFSSPNRALVASVPASRDDAEDGSEAGSAFPVSPAHHGVKSSRESATAAAALGGTGDRSASSAPSSPHPLAPTLPGGLLAPASLPPWTPARVSSLSAALGCDLLSAAAGMPASELTAWAGAEEEVIRDLRAELKALRTRLSEALMETDPLRLEYETRTLATGALTVAASDAAIGARQAASGAAAAAADALASSLDARHAAIADAFSARISGERGTLARDCAEMGLLNPSLHRLVQRRREIAEQTIKLLAEVSGKRGRLRAVAATLAAERERMGAWEAFFDSADEEAASPGTAAARRAAVEAAEAEVRVTSGELYAARLQAVKEEGAAALRAAAAECEVLLHHSVRQLEEEQRTAFERGLRDAAEAVEDAAHRQADLRSACASLEAALGGVRTLGRLKAGVRRAWATMPVDRILRGFGVTVESASGNSGRRGSSASPPLLPPPPLTTPIVVSPPSPPARFSHARKQRGGGGAGAGGAFTITLPTPRGGTRGAGSPSPATPAAAAAATVETRLSSLSPQRAVREAVGQQQQQGERGGDDLDPGAVPLDVVIARRSINAFLCAALDAVPYDAAFSSVLAVAAKVGGRQMGFLGRGQPVPAPLSLRNVISRMLQQSAAIAASRRQALIQEGPPQSGNAAPSTVVTVLREGGSGAGSPLRASVAAAATAASPPASALEQTRAVERAAAELGIPDWLAVALGLKTRLQPRTPAAQASSPTPHRPPPSAGAAGLPEVLLLSLASAAAAGVAGGGGRVPESPSGAHASPPAPPPVLPAIAPGEVRVAPGTGRGSSFTLEPPAPGHAAVVVELASDAAQQAAMRALSEPPPAAPVTVAASSVDAAPPAAEAAPPPPPASPPPKPTPRDTAPTVAAALSSLDAAAIWGPAVAARASRSSSLHSEEHQQDAERQGVAEERGVSNLGFASVVQQVMQEKLHKALNSSSSPPSAAAVPVHPSSPQPQGSSSPAGRGAATAVEHPAPAPLPPISDASVPLELPTPGIGTDAGNNSTGAAAAPAPAAAMGVVDAELAIGAPAPGPAPASSAAQSPPAPNRLSSIASRFGGKQQPQQSGASAAGPLKLTGPTPSRPTEPSLSKARTGLGAGASSSLAPQGRHETAAAPAASPSPASRWGAQLRKTAAPTAVAASAVIVSPVLEAPPPVPVLSGSSQLLPANLTGDASCASSNTSSAAADSLGATVVPGIEEAAAGSPAAASLTAAAESAVVASDAAPVAETAASAVPSEDGEAVAATIVGEGRRETPAASVTGAKLPALRPARTGQPSIAAPSAGSSSSVGGTAAWKLKPSSSGPKPGSAVTGGASASFSSSPAASLSPSMLRPTLKPSPAAASATPAAAAEPKQPEWATRALRKTTGPTPVAAAPATTAEAVSTREPAEVISVVDVTGISTEAVVEAAASSAEADSSGNSRGDLSGPDPDEAEVAPLAPQMDTALKAALEGDGASLLPLDPATRDRRPSVPDVVAAFEHVTKLGGVLPTSRRGSAALGSPDAVDEPQPLSNPSGTTSLVPRSRSNSTAAAAPVLDTIAETE